MIAAIIGRLGEEFGLVGLVHGAVKLGGAQGSRLKGLFRWGQGKQTERRTHFSGGLMKNRLL